MVARKTVLALGHSHLGALLGAVNDPDAGDMPLMDLHFLQIWGRGYDPMVTMVDGAPVFHEQLERDLLKLVGKVEPDVILTSLIGSEPTIWSIEGNKRPFDLILPYDAEAPRVAGAETIPYALFRSYVHAVIQPLLRFNRRIREITGIPVYQLLPPPPVANDMRLRDLPEPLRSTIEQTGVPAAGIRYKIWRTWLEVAAEIAAGDGIETIQAPEAALDPQGLLAEDYCADGVHGNARYGRLVLQTTAERLLV